MQFILREQFVPFLAISLKLTTMDQGICHPHRSGAKRRTVRCAEGITQFCGFLYRIEIIRRRMRRTHKQHQTYQ